MKELARHKFIVLGISHYNNVGLCKSIREAGYDVTFVETSGRGPSKFMKRHATYCETKKSIEEGIQYIISNYTDRDNRAFILTGQDDVVEALNNHYDELIGHFYFNNCGSASRTYYYLNKENLCQVAYNHGLIPPHLSWSKETNCHSI